jgi:hypothetical protein
MSSTRATIEVCNNLLKGELSAIECYDLAVEKFDPEHEQPVLRAIRADHQVNAELLLEQLAGMGAAPPDGPETGAFAQAVAETTSVLGEFPTLAALGEGEEHGIDECQEALRNPDVSEEIKIAIRQDLLPTLAGHIAELDHLRAR